MTPDETDIDEILAENEQAEQAENLAEVMASKTLELRTTEETPLDIGVKIDDTFYAYSDPGAWGLAKRAKYARIWKAMQAIENVKEPTEAQERQYDSLAKQLLQMTTPTLPSEVIDHLNMGNRMALVMDFFIKAAKQNPLLMGMMKNGRK
jgi:hypothetical protein